MAKEKKEQLPSLAGAVREVFYAALLPKVDETYRFQFPRREVLAKTNSVPEVQSVNQALDAKGVDLHERHLENFERGHKILQHSHLSFFDLARGQHKQLKNEAKIADEFRREVAAERAKGADANPKTVLYGLAGVIAHTLFGASLAAVNPLYAAIEDDNFGNGVTFDYLTSNK